MGSKKENKTENQKTAKTVRLDDIHWELIRGLTPFYGNNEPEVVRNIVIMWLHDNIGSQTITKLEDLNGVTFEGREKND